MGITAVADLVTGNPDWQVFIASAGITVFVGVALVLSTSSTWSKFTIRQAFLLTTLSWLVLAAFAALPFAFSELNLSYTDAFFESMSGITTTGSTVIVGLDKAPPSILLWRALLQWLGGIGIIVVAVAILPMLQVGGMQLFHMESSDRSEKVLPRAAQIASGIAIIYLIATIACAVAYWLGGMSAFEAFTHAMTTIATGGFSTSDSSVGVFDSVAIDWTATFFMVIGGMPFVLYLQAVRGKPMTLLRDSQIHWFLSIIALAIVGLSFWQWASVGTDLDDALRYSAFNVVSVITGTGYSTVAFDRWGGFAVTVFFLLMFIGGCAGSTSCGIKIFRFQVLYANARVQLARLLQPHGVFIPYFNRAPIPEGVTSAVLGFFFLFICAFGWLAMALGLCGLDFLTAVSGAATSIANVGPGLGSIIGPAGTFAPLPDAAKWLLSAGMLLGRLELFTVLVLFLPSFWRK
ncbi:MAG: TrkH family potassium uptake protein [Alphaproteobacteria bacterium]|nr:TrkH family potassium uptake protein [Alphaproteobacteria bacterium]